jgi:murein L,D-transpeptidase YafK
MIKTHDDKMLFTLKHCVILFIAILLCNKLHAQNDKGKNTASLPEPRDIKVLNEYKDGKGNIVRVIQYHQGAQLITETAIIPIKTEINTRIRVNPDTLNKDSVLLVVNKSKYNLEVYYRRRMIRSYKAVFGPKPLEKKVMEGDRRTPEGWFTIKNKNPNSRYDKFMGITYPNDSDIARFNQLKAKSSLPKTASIGGDVGIHGIWKGADDMIDKGVGWTDGCIALKNKDIEELYTLVGIGTRVFIRK